ncbi:26132_t:CDS:2, partial [Dentiscutata erythropus]
MATHSVDISEKKDEITSISSVEEKKLLKKLDLRIIPLLTLIFTLNFLDRVNIGNARLAHLERDLNLTGVEFNWCLGIFFFARFLLGVFESGLFPAIVFYITKWYTRSERSYRISLFFSGATISGAFSGLLAFAIINLDGKFGLSGWRWIFLIEGSATVIVSFFSYFLITDYVETATWLTEDERKLAVNRLLLDEGHGHTTRFDKSQIFQAFKDLKVYIFMFMYFCILVNMYSFAFFIPTIVNGLGFNAAILADHHKIRSPYLISCLLVAIIGYALIISENSSIALKYSGACIVGLGIFACVPNLLVWTLNNLSGDLKRAVGTAMAISWGNLGGIVSAQLYRPSDAPTYKFGHSIALSLLIASVLLSIVQYYYLNRMNNYKLNDPDRFLKGINEEEAKHL